MKEIATLPAICCGPATEPLAAHERDQLAAQFKALADPTRVAIVNQLSAADEVCVCNLTETFDLSQPTISHHLKILRDAGSARRRAEGRGASTRPWPGRTAPGRAHPGREPPSPPAA